MRRPTEYLGMLIVLLIAMAVGVACYAVARMDPWGEQRNGLPDSFAFDVSDMIRVDPARIHFRQSRQISLPLSQATAIATGPEDRLYVAGDRGVWIFDREGESPVRIALEDAPTSLAIGGREHAWPGRIYVGTGARIELFAPDGMRVGAWEKLGPNALATSIAVAANDVFVADAANRVVVRFDTTGNVVGKIGVADPDRLTSTFVVPGPYFDVVAGADEILYVSNPGVRRVEAFTFDGELQSFWGETSSALAGFFGCCNPTHLALLPDGRFITSEKGIPRIKVYGETGKFDCVVADSEQLGVNVSEIGDPRMNRGERVFDVAADSQGRVLVLDARHKCVRIYAPRTSAEGAE